MNLETQQRSPDLPVKHAHSSTLSRTPVFTAARRSFLGRWLIDLIWPSIEPLTLEEMQSEEQKRQQRTDLSLGRINAMSGRTLEELEAALETCKDLFAREKERRQSVDARLTTVLGLASVAAALTFGGLASQVWQGLSAPGSLGARVIGILGFYIVLQLLSAVWSSVHGLGRRAYLEPRAEDLLPLPQDTSDAHLKRQMRVYLQSLEDQHAQNSLKVSQMALAHRAVQNFLGGMLLLVLLFTALSFLPSGKASIEENVIRRLRSDPKLIELLRGPRGLTGERGPAGPPGPQGIRGERGPVSPQGPGDSTPTESGPQPSTRKQQP
jgi:hypothetical protein